MNYDVLILPGILFNMFRCVVTGKKDAPAVILLHGWGASAAAFGPIAKALENEYRVIAADMYGFGETPHPARALTVDDYADGVMETAKALNVETAVVLGHSFGGRVAVKTAVKYPALVRKLILVDAAGLKPRGVVFKRLRSKIHKILKKYNDRGLKGSLDYEAASGYLKATLVNVVNEYQEAEAAKIKCGALILWGGRDRDTKAYMAYRYKRLIRGSKLRVFPDAGHFSYLDRTAETIVLIKAYIGGE